jgi:hypothetical protein
MGARNRVIVPARQATLAGGTNSLESIPGLHKRLKIRAQGEKREMNDVKLLGDTIKRLTDVKEWII